MQNPIHSRKKIKNIIHDIIDGCRENAAQMGFREAYEKFVEAPVYLPFTRVEYLNGDRIFALQIWGGEIEMTEAAYLYARRSAIQRNVPVVNLF